MLDARDRAQAAKLRRQGRYGGPILLGLILIVAACFGIVVLKNESDPGPDPQAAAPPSATAPGGPGSNPAANPNANPGGFPDLDLKLEKSDLKFASELKNFIAPDEPKKK